MESWNIDEVFLIQFYVIDHNVNSKWNIYAYIQDLNYFLIKAIIKNSFFCISPALYILAI